MYYIVLQVNSHFSIIIIIVGFSMNANKSTMYWMLCPEQNHANNENIQWFYMLNPNQLLIKVWMDSPPI